VTLMHIIRTYVQAHVMNMSAHALVLTMLTRWAYRAYEHRLVVVRKVQRIQAGFPVHIHSSSPHRSVQALLAKELSRLNYMRSVSMACLAERDDGRSKQCKRKAAWNEISCVACK
jgi:hypothetical protein